MKTLKASLKELEPPARLQIEIWPDELQKLKIEAIRAGKTLRALVREKLGLDTGR